MWSHEHDEQPDPRPTTRSAQARTGGLRQQAVAVQTTSLQVSPATTGSEPRRGGE